jgi:hypothetical protein
MKLPFKPVPYARHWWRFHSIRWNVVGMLLTASATGVSMAGGAAAWVTAFDFRIVLVLALLIFVLSTAGALIAQEFKDKPGASNAGKATQ